MTPAEFNCGVAVNAPADLETFLNTVPPYWKLGESVFISRVGNPRTEHEFLKQRSPLSHAAALTAPLLVVQSANDSRVKREQGDSLVAALRRLKKPVRYLVLPEGGHTLGTWRYLSYIAAVEDFFGRCLGGWVETPLSWERWDDLEQ
jgi:dipeptidyl aminopeptidase/acylaminoacyl peptidase